jgi:ABC-2 type transport system permease protein
MTTLAPTAPAFTELDNRRAGTGFGHVLRSEWTKVWSLRSTFWTLLGLVTLTIGLSTLAAWGQTSSLKHMSPGDLAAQDPTNMAMSGLILGQLAIAVLGVLVVCSEYSTGGIKVTFTAVPDRMRVLAAKGVVLAAIATVVGMITAFGAFFAAMPFWAHYDMPAHLGDPGVLRAVLGGGLYVLASGMFGLAIGSVIRHTAGAITTVVGLLFVAPGLTELLPGEWGDQIAKHFTSNAGQRITEVVHSTSQLHPWPGYLTFTLWWVIPLALGAWLIKRRDA